MQAEGLSTTKSMVHLGCGRNLPLATQLFVLLFALGDACVVCIVVKCNRRGV